MVVEWTQSIRVFSWGQATTVASRKQTKRSSIINQCTCCLPILYIFSSLTSYHVISVVTEAKIMAHIPNPATIRLPRFRDGVKSGSNFKWIKGGKTKAIGHPSKLPISDTTLSRLSMVEIATTAKTQTRNDEITFRFWKNEVDDPHDLFMPPLIDRVAISKEGKFCKGNVAMTPLPIIPS